VGAAYDYWEIGNFDLDSPDTFCIDAEGDYILYRNLKVHGAGSTGIHNAGATYNTFINCEIYSNGSGGIYLEGGAKVISCYVHDNTADGIDSNAYSLLVENCIIEANTTNGISLNNATQQMVINNTIDGNGEIGIEVARDLGPVTILNNLITNHTTGAALGIYSNAGANEGHPHWQDYNAFYNNTTDVDTGFEKGSHSVDLSGDPYTNRTGHDFSLNNTAGAGAACRKAGFGPIGHLGSPIGTSYVDIGALNS